MASSVAADAARVGVMRFPLSLSLSFCISEVWMFAFADGSRLTNILPVVACVLASFCVVSCLFVLFGCVRLPCVGAACGCVIMRGAACGRRSC